jgi:hypothetical protein
MEIPPYTIFLIITNYIQKSNEFVCLIRELGFTFKQAANYLGKEKPPYFYGGFLCLHYLVLWLGQVSSRRPQVSRGHLEADGLSIL